MNNQSNKHTRGFNFQFATGFSDVTNARTVSNVSTEQPPPRIRVSRQSNRRDPSPEEEFRSGLKPQKRTSVVTQHTAKSRGSALSRRGPKLPNIVELECDSVVAPTVAKPARADKAVDPVVERKPYVPEPTNDDETIHPADSASQVDELEQRVSGLKLAPRRRRSRHDSVSDVKSTRSSTGTSYSYTNSTKYGPALVRHRSKGEGNLPKAIGLSLT